jgi:hypothetical protein
MQIEHLKINLQKKSKLIGFTYKLNQPAEKESILLFEEEIGLKIPQQIVMFYENYNGLEVHNPSLTVKPIEELSAGNDLIPFSVVDEKHEIGFDISKINEAGQWNIVNCTTRYLVTYTMASFWTNKILNWLVKNRTIWKEETYSFT